MGSDPAFRTVRAINIFEFGDGTFDVTATDLGRSRGPRRERKRLKPADAVAYVGLLLERSPATAASEEDDQDDDQQQDDRVDEDAPEQHDQQQDQ